MAELWQLSAGEIARRIRRRETSSREVVASHLHRIEAVNPVLNAVTVMLADEAFAAADAADRTLASGGDVGPLCGVPFTVKEGIALKGSATTHGLAWLRRAIAPHDDPHIAELRAAGAIPLARTNMPELGMRWHTDNALRGATRNPWDASRTPGGSSGGEAAALAAGLTPLGMGSDGAGSLRWPAQCCGIAALKPPPPTPMRVALLADPGAGPMHPDVAAALQVAARALSDAGYAVDERTPPQLERASQVYTQLMERYGRTTPERVPPPPGMLSADFERFWTALDPTWQAAMGAPVHDLLMERAGLSRVWSELMQDTPLLLAPIATQPPWRVGEDLEPGWGPMWLPALRMVVVVNLLGLPAVAVPTGLASGLPCAVQIIGPRFREDLCLAAAEAIERSLPAFTPIDPVRAVASL